MWTNTNIGLRYIETQTTEQGLRYYVTNDKTRHFLDHFPEAKKMVKEQKEIEPNIKEIIDKNYWDLI